MATEIRVYAIKDGQIEPLNSSMEQAGRKEREDLEKWIKSYPGILGENILIIGEQVNTDSGPLDLLGIDEDGNTVIVEIKRGKIPRDALTQAIDYAADVASWDKDRLNSVCLKYHQEELESQMNEKFQDIDFDDIVVNGTQRILLVGTYIEESLERMVGWLSNQYGMSINALIFRYINTEQGDELIAKTMIIPEELEKERTKRHSRFTLELSDKPGNYKVDELKEKLMNYLRNERDVPRRIREIILPLCLENDVVTREMIKEKLVEVNEAADLTQAGFVLTTISRELGFTYRDDLRQVIAYDKEGSSKINYKILEEYKDLIGDVIKALKG